LRSETVGAALANAATADPASTVPAMTAKSLRTWYHYSF
jgi:hypothetical protein